MPSAKDGSWKQGPTKSPTAGAIGLSILQRIREEFRQCGGSNENALCPEKLSCHWLRLAEAEQRRLGRAPLSVLDKQVIALYVSQSMQEMDLKGHCRVDMDEWVHHMLLMQMSIPSVMAFAQVNSLLKGALQQHPRILEDLQRMFEVADKAKQGVLTFAEIVEMYSRKLWHLRPSNDGRQLSDAELQAGDPKEFAKDIIGAMDLDGNDQISYVEFMAYCLGRRKQEVLLHFYDLSNGTAKALSPWLIGEQLEGLWHTGVVVFGKEYYFGGEIFYDTPGETSFGQPTKVISLGHTLWRQEELHYFIVDELRPLFTRDTYDVVNNNCNHFTDRVAMMLAGRHIPDEVLLQPECLVKLGACTLRPLLNRWLGSIEATDKDQELGKSGELPSHQWVAGDVLPAGMVVTVHPSLGREPTLLGMVVRSSQLEAGHIPSVSAQGQRCPDSQRPGRSKSQPPSSKSVAVNGAWVRYFGLTPTNSARCSLGRVHTEFVERSRLSVARLDDLGGEAVYQAAMQAMMAVVPEVLFMPHESSLAGSARTQTHRCGGTASGRLAPLLTPRPGSMLLEEELPSMDEDSPRKPAAGSFRKSRNQSELKRVALDQLSVMGFDAETAQAALVKTDWHVDDAVALLRHGAGSFASNSSSTTASKSWSSHATCEGSRLMSGSSPATRTASGSLPGSASASIAKISSSPASPPMPNFALGSRLSGVAEDDEDMAVPPEWGYASSVGAPRDLPGKNLQRRDDSRDAAVCCKGINERLSRCSPNRLHWWSARLKSLDRLDSLEREARQERENAECHVTASHGIVHHSPRRGAGTPRGNKDRGRGRCSSQQRPRSASGRARPKEERAGGRQPQGPQDRGAADDGTVYCL